jgi:hypothetical protein
MSANVKNVEFTLAEPRQARLKPSAVSPNLGKSTETIFQTITFQKTIGSSDEGDGGSEEGGGDTPGGDTPGGDTPGGDTPGGGGNSDYDDGGGQN